MNVNALEDDSSEMDRIVKFTQDPCVASENIRSNAATSSSLIQVENSAQDKSLRSISDVPVLSLVHHYHAQEPMPAQLEQETDSKCETAELLQHSQQRSIDGGAAIKSRACQVCGLAFSSRKSLLRHSRTVHRAKAFHCSSCRASFTRNDVLMRHVAEHHAGNIARIKCVVCGKNISERAFHEHLDSQACTQRRLKMSNQSFDDLRFGFPGQDDDAFLVTIQMFIMLNLKLSYNVHTGEADLTSEVFARNKEGQLSMKIERIAAWECLYGRVLYLTRQQIDRDITALHISAALWASALILGLLAFTRGCDRDAWKHWKGAAAVLATRHNRACECGSYDACKRWRQPTGRDPTLALVVRILEERGFLSEQAAHLQLSMTQDDKLRDMCLHHFKILEIFLKN
jgi:hypothetical protein